MRRLAPGLLGLLTAGLAACGLGADADQLRVCRSVLPALNSGERVVVERAEPGPLPRTLRLDYRVEREGRAPLRRYATCAFAAEGLSSHKADLVGLATETGPVAGASLYLLKRYYLDTPEGLAGDPGGPAASSVPEVPAALAYALQQFLISLPRTAK